MVLVKEDTVKPFTRTLGAVGATMITAALVVGVALSDNSAAGSTTSTTPTSMSMPTESDARHGLDDDRRHERNGGHDGLGPI